MEPQTGAVVLLGVPGQDAQVELGEPQVRQVAERARGPQDAGARERWSLTDAFLQAGARGGRGGPGGPNLAESAAQVTDAGLRHHTTAVTSGVDLAVGADRGAGGGRRASPACRGWRSASSTSIWASQASTSLTRKRTSRPTRNPRGPRPWLRRSWRVWTVTPSWAASWGRVRTRPSVVSGCCGLHADQVRQTCRARPRAAQTGRGRGPMDRPSAEFPLTCHCLLLITGSGRASDQRVWWS